MPTKELCQKSELVGLKQLATILGLSNGYVKNKWKGWGMNPIYIGGTGFPRFYLKDVYKKIEEWRVK